jgi:hypothetical protein
MIDGAGRGVEMVYFPGMVNLSGTLCYMNSVLQVRPLLLLCVIY